MPRSSDAFEQFLSDFNLTSLRSSASVLPRMPAAPPTLAEFAQMGEETASRHGRGGLFEELLGGRLDVLFDDMARAPKKYELGARALVEDLVVRRLDLKALPGDQRELLDRATVDYAASPRVAPQPTSGTQVPSGKRRPLADVSATTLPRFWWVK
jgi:hypothetical protein